MKVFISYSHKDDVAFDRLRTHLAFVSKSILMSGMTVKFSPAMYLTTRSAKNLSPLKSFCCW